MNFGSGQYGVDVYGFGPPVNLTDVLMSAVERDGAVSGSSSSAATAGTGRDAAVSAVAKDAASSATGFEAKAA